MIHSALKVPANKRGALGANGSDLSRNAQRGSQNRMAGVYYILVDEMSMISQDLLGLMSTRGRQAVRGRPTDGTDDSHNILLGDPMQLPPVGAAPVWSDRPTIAGHTVEGRNVWLGLNACGELTEVMQQLRPAQVAFRQALLAVAKGRATREHYNLFTTRMRTSS